jgi:plastocyanin
MRRASAVVAVAALSVLGLAACGGGGDDNETTAAATPPATTAPTGGGGGGSTVDISTPSGSELAYNQKDVSAKAGTVTIDFQNNESISHDVAVEDSSGKTLGQTDLISSGSANTTVDLTAGTYTFFCTVPGHREAGMEGTLTVK